MTAFNQLTADMAILPTLRQPDFSKPFELHTDAASNKGIAVVLCQRVEDTPYPLSFASRSLSPPEQTYSVQEIEALAIVWGIKKFRPFLEYGHFTVFTDHSSLQWLLKTKELNRLLLRLSDARMRIRRARANGNHGSTNS